MVQARRRPVAPDRFSGEPENKSVDGWVSNRRSPSHEPPAVGPAAVRTIPGLAGFAIVIIVASNLGLPLPGGYLAVDVLLVTIGFDLARGCDPSTRQTTPNGGWLRAYGLCLVGRICVPAGLAVGLTALYQNSQAPLEEPMLRAVLGAVTMTLNWFLIFGGASFGAIEHLWMIGIVIQFSLIAPILVTAGRRRISRDQRASAIIGLAVGIAICRLGFAADQTAAFPSIAINTLTRIDGLLVGLAIGVAPLATVRRHMHPGMAAAAFAVLLLLFLAAPTEMERPGIALGLMIPLAVALAGVIVATTAAEALTGAIAATLNNQMLRWLGALAISLYIWHYIFGSLLQSGLSGSTDTMNQWPGFALLILRISFALAAAATSYRYLERPAMARVILGVKHPSVKM